VRTAHGGSGPLDLPQESEERFRKLFEYSNGAIFVIDPDGGATLDANECARKLSPASRSQSLRFRCLGDSARSDASVWF